MFTELRKDFSENLKYDTSEAGYGASELAQSGRVRVAVSWIGRNGFGTVRYINIDGKKVLVQVKDLSTHVMSLVLIQ